MSQNIVIPSALIVSKIVRFIGAGLSDESACALAGVEYEQFQKWMELSDILNLASDDDLPNDEHVIALNGLADDVRLARAKLEMKLVRCVVKAVNAGDWQASAWLLSHRFSDEYGQTFFHHVRLSVNDDGELVAMMSADGEAGSTDSGV